MKKAEKMQIYLLYKGNKQHAKKLNAISDVTFCNEMIIWTAKGLCVLVTKCR